MRKEDKKALIDSMSVQLAETSNLYLTDVSGMNAEDTSDLRRLCYKYNITMRVVKNTLLKKLWMLLTEILVSYTAFLRKTLLSCLRKQEMRPLN